MDVIELLKQCPIQYLIEIATDNNHNYYIKTLHMCVALPFLINNNNDYNLCTKENCDYETLIKANGQKKVNWP